MIHANGHCAEADAPPEATKKQVLEMRAEIRFPPRPWIEELLLGDVDVIAMLNRQLQTSAHAALPTECPAYLFEQMIEGAEQLPIIDFIRGDDDGSLHVWMLNHRQHRRRIDAPCPFMESCRRRAEDYFKMGQRRCRDGAECVEV